MSLLAPFFLDCVVAIGIEEMVMDKDGKEKPTRSWVASGFLYGHLVETTGQNLYKVFLVTNRHVVQGKSQIFLRFNPTTSGPAKEYPINLMEALQNGAMSVHPAVDLAAVALRTEQLDADGIQYSFFQNDSHVANKTVLESQGFSEGDGVFVLGFPMGRVGGDRNYVIVRHGVIARIRDYLANVSNEILVDALTFPGNSGGPVVSRPEAMSIVGTKSQNAAYLLGVTSSFISYQDVAISQQTKRPRIVFEDNSGLTSVVPIQFLTDFIDNLFPKLKKEEAEQVVSPSPAMEEDMGNTSE